MTHRAREVPEPPTPRAQRRAASGDAATRTRLIEATSRLISGEGLTAATSRRITEEAGTNLASITYWFGSKQALVDAALRSEVAVLVDPALEVLEADGDPGPRMLEAIGSLLETFAERSASTTAYLTALIEAARPPAGPESSRAPDPTREVVARIRRRLSSVNSELVATGAVPDWVDPDAMASLIVAAANGIALQCALEPGGPSAADQAGQLALLLLAARADPPSEGARP
ncbi:MAG: TetR/AcrR family transcriptional regulator [Actinobacteria bacterium]|nr:TetR/AcrR family transcriptional regulator [Actinomycetota bacterium]